jgi:hypothetical protein
MESFAIAEVPPSVSNAADSKEIEDLVESEFAAMFLEEGGSFLRQPLSNVSRLHQSLPDNQGI